MKSLRRSTSKARRKDAAQRFHDPVRESTVVGATCH